MRTYDPRTSIVKGKKPNKETRTASEILWDFRHNELRAAAMKAMTDYIAFIERHHPTSATCAE